MALTGIRELKMIETAVPVIRRDTDVLIRMLHMGVCGSDMHLYKTGQIGDTPVRFPFVPGHEGCGVVEKAGEAVSRVRKGDLIAIEPAISCGQCDQCREGRFNTCRNLSFLGSPGQSDGLLSEWIVMPEQCCFPLPEGMDSRLGCLAEPLSIDIYATQLAGSLKGKNVAVLGSGPIGMGIIMYARTQDVAGIYATDLIPGRLEKASLAGADWTGNPDQQDVVRDILSEKPPGVDLIFECCGKQEAMDQAVELLRPGGKILIVGIPEFDNWIFAADRVRRKEICLQNVRRQNNCLGKAIDTIAGGSIDAGSLITHEFPFPGAGEAFDLVARYDDGVMKAMVTLP